MRFIITKELYEKLSKEERMEINNFEIPIEVGKRVGETQGLEVLAKEAEESFVVPNFCEIVELIERLNEKYTWLTKMRFDNIIFKI